MAVLNVPGKNLTFSEAQEIAGYLAKIGIDYERWETDSRISPDAAPEEILAAYAGEIEKLKAAGGYVTADVIDIKPETPNLESMLERFRPEHWHDEDEVRFIVKGRGCFHIAPPGADVVSITMEAGDLIRVPRGTKHWFDLCEDRTVRAIRLFQDISGWTPHYTKSGLEKNYRV
ncbi:MAG TPA: cupin domain-containing protein [Pyrinomonadaceae bacterium]|jgi:1,2-dihydroxy-3-keto-5-methylthiopentene dioxygenase